MWTGMGIGPIDGGMFNLGYLPRGDKSITTLRPTTLEAIQKALSMLKKDGVLVVAVYPGHPEGELEGRMVQSFASRLDKYYFNVILYRYINHPGSAFLFAFEKSKEGLPEGWTDWCRQPVGGAGLLTQPGKGEQGGRAWTVTASPSCFLTWTAPLPTRRRELPVPWSMPSAPLAYGLPAGTI